MLTAVMFFLFATSIIVLGTSSSVLREMQVATNVLKTKASYFTSESGAEDVIYRTQNGIPVSNNEIISLDGFTATTLTTSGSGGESIVTAQSDRLGYTRKITATLTTGSGGSFFYGVQVGLGGLTLNNSAFVVGNVYSDGPVVGTANISSNPSNPDFVSSVTVGPTAQKAVWNGSYVYVVNETTVQTVNVSNHASPAVVSTVTNPDTSSNPQQKDIAVANGHLFITATNHNNVRSVSISNPAAPVFLGQVAVSGGPQAIEVSGSYAYVLSYSGATLKTINISNPSAMAVVSTVTTNPGPIELAVQGSYLYVVSQNGTQKLEIFSLANPASPTLVGSVTISGNPIPLSVNGSYAYIGSKSGSKLEVVNVSNPALPVLVGGSASNSVIDPKGLYATGSYLYVAVSYGSTNQFQVWDISNPSVWSNVNTVTISGGAPVFVTGGQSGYLYLLTQNANATSPLRIYRVTGSGGNMIYGDVVSSGASGSITKIHATSSLYAKTITNSLTDKNAYYQTISNTTVLGTSYPGSANQPAGTFPISDEQITGWETDAAAGGTATCDESTYTINGTVTLGPKKIPCDLSISSNAIVSFAGPVWVSGNITISNNSVIKVASGLSGKTVPIIADKLSNRSSSSRIELSNNTNVQGSGTNSYLLFVSQNNSAETGGGTTAIIVSNNLTGAVLLYAPHGEVLLSNNVRLKEVTAYKLTASNNAEIIYESGLANLIFTSGPSGGYSIGGWGASQ